MIKIEGCKCTRCDHSWVPHKTNPTPRVCPKCKSPYWNIKKK